MHFSLTNRVGRGRIGACNCDAKPRIWHDQLSLNGWRPHSGVPRVSLISQDITATSETLDTGSDFESLRRHRKLGSEECHADPE